MRLAHFEVLTRADGALMELGKGAMGVTYKAFDLNLAEYVVVKVLSPSLQTNPNARKRFLQEARMMAGLKNHPHIVSILHLENSPVPFYAMEFCEGTTLDAQVKHSGPLGWEAVFALGHQASLALQTLENQRLVHRDLKPANIILTESVSGETHLKLIDFGIAKELYVELSGGLTQTDGFVGTPAYASPEQTKRVPSVDSRSDFYSLGLVIWFCLTGKTPKLFCDESSDLPWELLPSGISEAALNVLRRMLAPDKHDRFATAADLTDAIICALGGSVPKIGPLTDMRLSDTEPFLGGFRQISQVEEDDFGTVWRAQNAGKSAVLVRDFKAIVARNKSAVRRMQSLVLGLNGTTHPNWHNVVHFEHKVGRCALALEMIEGPSIQELMALRPGVTFDDLLPLLRDLGQALDFGATGRSFVPDTNPNRIKLEIAGSNWGAPKDWSC